jgi:hypothetical protein
MGRVNGGLYVAARALSRLTGDRARLLRYHFVAQPVPETAPANAVRASRMIVRCVAPPDRVIAQFPRADHVVADRFARGCICFVAERDGRFMGFLWLARNGYDEDEVRCRYELADPQRSAFDFDVYVEPQFRAGRCFAALWEAANGYLATQGVRWSVSRISAFNPASLAAHRRLGIRTLFSGSFLRLGAVQLAVLGVPPFVHLSLNDRSRPCVALACPDQ